MVTCVQQQHLSCQYQFWQLCSYVDVVVLCLWLFQLIFITNINSLFIVLNLQKSTPFTGVHSKQNCMIRNSTLNIKKALIVYLWIFVMLELVILHQLEMIIAVYIFMKKFCRRFPSSVKQADMNCYCTREVVGRMEIFA